MEQLKKFSQVKDEEGRKQEYLARKQGRNQLENTQRTISEFWHRYSNKKTPPPDFAITSVCKVQSLP